MPEAEVGLLASARRLLSTLTSIASTRLELLANELQEERVRLTQMLLLSLLALFCFCMGILLLTMFVIVLWWDDQRLAVIGILSLLFLTLGVVMSVVLRRKVRVKSRLFHVSLAEFDKDREQLKSTQTTD